MATFFIKFGKKRHVDYGSIKKLTTYVINRGALLPGTINRREAYMELIKIMSLLGASGFIPPVRFYKYVMNEKTKSCADCLRFAGEIFAENDPRIPSLPRHPNCDCFFIEVDQDEYIRQKNFEFGRMTHDEWFDQSEEKKFLWCNSFRNRFGNAIDKYAKMYNIPKQLLAGIIANEMLDWRFPDGTLFDGIGGGGIGYAQIAIKTARKHGATGSNSEIKSKLNSYEGCVEIAAKILKDYFNEFCDSAQNDKLGPGFKRSTLYYMPQPHILQHKNFIDMKVPEWLLNTMCAVWNSGIGVIYARDKIGDNNYRNANAHGLNSSYLLKYLPKLVNE